jgi:hypothetical protein
MITELITIIECTELFGVHPREEGCNSKKDRGIGSCSSLQKPETQRRAEHFYIQLSLLVISY